MQPGIDAVRRRTNKLELTAAELADVLGYEGGQKCRVRAARRWLRRLGIARQDTPRGQVYCTLQDLQAEAGHVWVEHLFRES